jgi:TRAP-type C4-dicarboxylate transport system permease small subunit
MPRTSIVPKILNRMETAVEWTVTAIVAIMVINISLGVFFRYILQNALFWTEEMSRYFMIWAGMLGAGLALKEDSHVGINFVVDLFPPAVKLVLRIIAKIIVSIFLAIVLVESFGYLKNLSIQKSAAMQIPMAIPYLSVTAGAILMSIENLVLISRLLVKAENSGSGK